MLEAGIKGTQEVKVTEENTALTMGSGTLKVFATPSMIALMEKTAWRALHRIWKRAAGTVGTQLNVSHLSATPLGMTVRCESELTEVDGRKLVFKVAAYDDAGLIGEGTHERFIVKNEKFQAKADSKANA